MLPRQRRIGRQKFPLVFQAGRLWSTPVLSLRIARCPINGTQKLTSFSFIVSHKVAIRAVDRNLLKRRVRAIVRELLPKIKDNYDCLLFFKKGATNLSYWKLKNIIQEIFTRTSIIIQ